jgi:hypothetical protein
MDPHQGDIDANGRRRERGEAEEGELMIVFKPPNDG